MDIIDVCGEILFIANLMLPKTGLPNIFYMGWFQFLRAFLSAPFLEPTYPLIVTNGKTIFYQTPPRRKIIITIGQCPYAMDVIGQQHKSVDFK
jgi:hypothetical protein